MGVDREPHPILLEPTSTTTGERTDRCRGPRTHGQCLNTVTVRERLQPRVSVVRAASRRTVGGDGCHGPPVVSGLKDTVPVSVAGRPDTVVPVPVLWAWWTTGTPVRHFTPCPSPRPSPTTHHTFPLLLAGPGFVSSEERRTDSWRRPRSSPVVSGCPSSVRPGDAGTGKKDEGEDRIPSET